MFTIGIPAFCLALENNTNPIQGRFMSNVLYKALPAGLTDFLIVSAIVIFSVEFEMSATDVSTSSTLLMSIVGFMILYRISKPMNHWRRIILISMMVGLLFCSLFMRNLFNINQISTKSAMLLVVFAIASESLFRYITLLINQIRIFGLFLNKKICGLYRKVTE